MDHPVFIGIVGSRRRSSYHDYKIVQNLVQWLVKEKQNITIVSGGCAGSADEFAEDMAGIMKLEKLIFPINKIGVNSKWEFTQMAYERNLKIAEHSQELYCLVSSDRTGGTENTIKHMLGLKKPVFLVTETGDVYLSKDGTLPTCEPVARLLD